MSQSEGWGPACGAVLALVLVACGGGAKPADSPGMCPNGTILREGSCVPSESKDPVEEVTPAPPIATSSSASEPGGAASSAPSETPAAATKTPYDKEAVEAELKRAARAIKASCGAATDDEGQATGPWGATKASVTLGRNGHIRQVTVPDPYAGKPVGVCTVHAFQKIWFPPYAASSDAVVDWDVELVKPKK